MDLEVNGSFHLDHLVTSAVRPNVLSNIYKPRVCRSLFIFKKLNFVLICDNIISINPSLALHCFRSSLVTAHYYPHVNSRSISSFLIKHSISNCIFSTLWWNSNPNEVGILNILKLLNKCITIQMHLQKQSYLFSACPHPVTEFCFSLALVSCQQ